MHRKSLAILLVFMVLTAAGCSAARGAGAGKENNEPTQPTEQIRLAGIYLGDTAQTVQARLGKGFTEEYYAEGGYFGEPIYRWIYPDGIDLIIGKETRQVLQIAITGEKLSTSQGDWIGDSAETIVQKYKEKYPQARDHFQGLPLEGWFVVEEGVWLIFDCNKDDGTLVNEKIGPASAVEQMVLVYEKFMD